MIVYDLKRILNFPHSSTRSSGISMALSSTSPSSPVFELRRFFILPVWRTDLVVHSSMLLFVYCAYTSPLFIKKDGLLTGFPWGHSCFQLLLCSFSHACAPVLQKAVWLGPYLLVANAPICLPACTFLVLF